jgi:hypothetical protein
VTISGEGKMAQNRMFLMITVALVILLNIDGYCSDKDADRWILYGTSKNGDHYYDKNSMTHVSPKIIQVWGKTKYSKFGKDQQIQLRRNRKFSIAGWDKFDYDITLKEVDCSKNTYKVLKIINYNDEGEIFQNIDNPNPSTIQTPPGSMGETFLKKVCSEK